MENVSSEALQKESFDGDHLAALSTQYAYTADNHLTIYAATGEISFVRDYDYSQFEIDHLIVSEDEWSEPRTLSPATVGHIRAIDWTANLPVPTTGLIGHG
jgi:hypothetical protein